MFIKQKYFSSVLLCLLFINCGYIYGQTTTCNSVNFNLATDYQAGPNAYSFVSADLNNDGITDIATANYDAKTISVLFGDGAGGFAPPRDYSTEITIRSVASGDFNNDRKPDLIVGDANNGKIAVLLNDGRGAFTNLNVITFPSNNIYGLNKLITADFNGDGNLDVAGLTSSNFSIFLGNGQGGLTQNTTIILGGGFQNQFAVGDFNGDHLADLAVTQTGGSNSSFEVLIVFGSRGGTFSINTRLPLSNEVNGIVTGDFNGDGKTDLVLATNYPYSNSTPQTHYLESWLGDGVGNFSLKSKFSYPSKIEGLVSGDFNGDGKPDLATAINSIVATVVGTGDGTFINDGLWAMPSSTQLLLADVNKDGKSDLLTLRAVYPKSFLSVAIRNEVGFALPKPVLYGTTEVEAADLNNDGYKDYISAYKTSYYTSEVVIALNDTHEGLLTDRNFETPANLTAMKTGDFNGDGNIDVITAHSGQTKKLAVFLGNGTGTIASPIINSLDIPFENLIVGDFNSDGKDDVFGIDNLNRGYSLISNGDGTFAIAPNFPVTLQGSNIKLKTGDFNGDDKLDLIISSGSDIKLWIGNGNGQFAQSAAIIPPLGSVVTGDFNGDGNLDLAGFNGGELKAVLGNGSGEFGQTFSQNLKASTGLLISADFNSDGFDDVAYSSDSQAGNLVVVPSGGRTLSWNSPSLFWLSAIGNSLVAADYNMDGKPDISYASQYGSRGVIYNAGGQTPCLSINDVTVTEGDSGTTTAAFTVSLSAPGSEVVRVNYTLEGQTATIGTDLQNVSGRLEIPAGQKTATINVLINGDIIDEFDETFTVNLSSASNADLGKAIGNGTITDDDDEPTLTVTDVAQNETGSYQSFVFRVNLSAPSAKPISFRCATADGTATAGKDYSSFNNTFNIPIGAVFADCYVGVFGDNIYEPDETFFLNISEAVNASIADAQGEGKIINDDPIPTLNIYGNNVLEGDSGTKEAAVNIQLTNPSYLPVTFHVLTSSGTATAGSDYVASDTIVTIPAEQQTATTNVQIIGDTINEPNETFFVNLYDAVNANLSVTQTQYLIVDDEPVSNDYDGDGKTDFVVFRPNGGTWYTLFSSTNSFTGRQYGASTDIPVSGDYNGDGRTDIAVWRPSNGIWYTPVPNRSQQWGTAGDIPVQGDYDNDGKIDFAVFRPSDGYWYIRQSSNDSYKSVQFGIKDDIPVPADYDGDGKTDIAVVRQSNGVSIWYILGSTRGFYALQFGKDTDKPVPADYDGDGKADITVFRDGYWYYLRSSEDDKFYYFQWGKKGDKPVPGNYDGDDKTDFAVYREDNWYIYQSSDGSFLSKQFGASDDIPIPFVSNN